MKIDGLPDDLNNAPLVKEAPDMATLIKTALAYQAQQGTSIRIPGEGASAEEQAQFREKAQRIGLVPRETYTDFVKPAKPELYEIKEPPKGAAEVATQAEVDQWKVWAHKQGLSPQQFEAFAVEQINHRIDAATQRKERFGAANEKVKARFGEAGVEAAKARALAAMEKFHPDLAARMAEDPDPDVVIAMAEVGKLFQERGMGDLTPRTGFIDAPAEAALKLDEIRRNPLHPFNQAPMVVGTAVHEAAKREVMNLQRLALGQRPLGPKADYLFEEPA